MFERFHRVEGAQGRSHEGSGIGLALVQELVKLHGGELAATSEPGQRQRLHGLDPARRRASARRTRSWHERDGRGNSGRVVVRGGSVALASGQSGGGDRRIRLPAARGTAGTGVHVGRVLLADDNADMRDYARRLLAERWHVDAVEQRP